MRMVQTQLLIENGTVRLDHADKDILSVQHKAVHSLSSKAILRY